MPWGPFAMIICYLSLATWVPISCVMSRRGGAVKNRADLYMVIITSVIRRGWSLTSDLLGKINPSDGMAGLLLRRTPHCSFGFWLSLLKMAALGTISVGRSVATTGRKLARRRKRRPKIRSLEEKCFATGSHDVDHFLQDFIATSTELH